MSIVLLVVASILAATMAFMVATSGSSASDNLRSAQALFLADSGLEYEQRQLAQNVDWYRATSDPFDVPPSPINVGQGSFPVVVNLPATELRTRLNAGSGAATATVFAGGSGTRWPAHRGTLSIRDDLTPFNAT